MAKVYRVKDAEGEGLWYGGGAFRLGWSNTENKRHPSPRTDPVLGPYFKRSIFGGVYPVGEVGDSMTTFGTPSPASLSLSSGFHRRPIERSYPDGVTW